MTDRLRCSADPTRSGLPEPIAAIIREKDWIIRRQTKRIEDLEKEVEQLNRERQRLNTKLALLAENVAFEEQRTAAVRAPPQCNPVPTTKNAGVTPVEMNSLPNARSWKIPISGIASSDATFTNNFAKCNADLTRNPPNLNTLQTKTNCAAVESCTLAASTIQHAYRRYLMNKNFTRLRSEAERSKRMIEQTLLHSESCKSKDDKSFQNGDLGMGVVSHPKVSSLGTIDEHSIESARIEDGAHQQMVYPELSDSSDNESVIETALEPAFDESSTNFEHLLEAEDIDGADDSFNSEDSQEGDTFSSRCSTLRAGNFGGFPQQWSSLTTSYENPNGNNQSATFRTRLSDAAFSDSDSMSGDVSTNQMRLEDASSIDSCSFGNNSHMSGDMLKFCAVEGNFDAFFHFYAPNYSPIWKRKSDSQSSTGSLTDANSPRLSQLSSAGSMETSDLSRSFTDVSQKSDKSSRCSVPDDVNFVGERKFVNPVGYAKHLSPYHGAPSLGVFHDIPQETRCHHLLAPLNSCDNEACVQSDRLRKRVYRIGLNLFNRKPERGIKYLIENKFIDLRPNAVARFLISRKGLSRQMVGEYLGNIQKPFNVEVLRCFADEIDLAGLQVDVALRKYQSFFRMHGEAQKIERLMEVFARRYCACNLDQVRKFRTPDTVFLLAFAIVMLNTDQHNKCIKDERRMKLRDFVNNLRGIDDGHDVNHDLVAGIFERVRSCEFKPASDHVTQVAKVEEMITGKKPSLQLLAQHRRLVCYCRLYEVPDISKAEKPGSHQREIFLFNDLIVVTKMMSKKKKSVSYSFRQSFSLFGVAVYLFETPYYRFGVRLMLAARGKELITLCARTEHDRIKFVDDLKETILELEEMEVLESYENKKEQSCQSNINRSNLSRQGSREVNRHSKDSGVADIERLSHRLSDCEERKNSISSSVFDFSERHRTESRGSLDSGMVSTGSSSTSSCTEPVKPGHSHSLRSHSATTPCGCTRESVFRKNKASN